MTIIQPARKSYFFGKGYRDLFNTIKEAWKNNKGSASLYWSNISCIDWTSKWAGLFKFVMYLIATISVVIIGTLFTLLISIFHIIILLCVMFIVYVSFSIIWGLDRIYLYKKRIFSPCTVCTKSSKYLIPTYLCPNCGVEHTLLVPGVYGILKRECNCGTLIPTTFFNGRRNLSAICPNPDCKAPIYGKEAAPICIPIVGGPSVGKTMFITAFVKNFVESVVPASNWEIEHYSPEKEQLVNNILSNFNVGRVPKTTDRSAISFNFFLKSKDNHWNPEKLFFIYDIAGEVFGGEAEDRLQKQYLYCHGVVFIIDPFSCPDIMADYASKIPPADLSEVSQINPNDALDIFIEKLQDIAGLSPSELSKVPIAVVINKTDMAGLHKFFNKNALTEVISNSPKKLTYSEAQNIACKNFLRENGMANLVQTIEMKFKTNKFFNCSSLGHSIGKGSFKPSNVMPPMKWIISKNDKNVAKSWKRA